MQQKDGPNQAASSSPPIIDTSTLGRMAAVVGFNLTKARAESLLPQAESHFRLLQAVGALDPLLAEPAGTLLLGDSDEESEDV